MKKLKSLGYAGIFAALAFSTGCTVTTTMTEKKVSKEIFLRADASLGVDFIMYNIDLGDNIKSRRFALDNISRSSEVDLDQGWGFSPKLKIEGFAGHKYLNLGLSIEGKYNLFFSSEDDDPNYSDGYESEDVTADSFVFTQFTPAPITFTPALSINTTLIDKLRLSVELGFPFVGFKVVSGQNVNGREEAQVKDSWRGFGGMLGGRIGWEFSDKVGLYLATRYEIYKMDLAGESARVDTFLGSLNLRYEF